MDASINPASCSQEHSVPQTLCAPETGQATVNTMPVKKRVSSNSIIKNNGKPDLKLAGAGMTEFHKYVDLPIDLRTKIMRMNMFEDPVVSDPRIIKVFLDWRPEEQDCYMNHDPPADRPRREWNSGQNEEEEEGEDEDQYHHTHIYDDHVNFVWKIHSDSAADVRRSQRPLISYYRVSKEVRSMVLRFVIADMGRRTRAFRSPELRWLPLSPTQDIFHIVGAQAWEAVNEWASLTLRAPRDALYMDHIMVDFDTFHGLIEPALREKDEHLLYLSDSESTDYFEGESSICAVLRNAFRIYIVASPVKSRIATRQDMVIWKPQDIQKEAVPGLQSETKEVLESVWTGKNTEFNRLRNGDGNSPMVLYVTAQEKKAEAQEDGLGDDQ